MKQVYLLYKHCEKAKHLRHGSTTTALIQKLPFKTSCQDFCKAVMSQLHSHQPRPRPQNRAFRQRVHRIAMDGTRSKACKYVLISHSWSAGYCGRGWDERLPRAEGGVPRDRRVSLSPAASLPADPQHHRSGEELHHHLPPAHWCHEPLHEEVMDRGRSSSLILQSYMKRRRPCKMMLDCCMTDILFFFFLDWSQKHLFGVRSQAVIDSRPANGVGVHFRGASGNKQPCPR